MIKGSPFVIHRAINLKIWMKDGEGDEDGDQDANVDDNDDILLILIKITEYTQGMVACSLSNCCARILPVKVLTFCPEA